jgi:hypothetical protein
MLTDWSVDELVEMRELALAACVTIKGSETRYGLQWHGLSQAIIVLDRLLRGLVNQHGRTPYEPSERDAKLLACLHAASKAQRSGGVPTVDYAERASERR